jgi:hypothetical protein
MNLDYQKLYESQNEMNTSDSIKKYKKYLNLFSTKNPKCLFCRKKKIILKKDDDKISINCTNCKWDVRMLAPIYLNIDILYKKLDNSDKLIKINKIVKKNFENKIYEKNTNNCEKEFEKLQQEIKKNMNNKKKINEIYEMQEKELNIIKNKKYNNYKKLHDLKNNRKKYYTNICFDKEIKKLLFEVYKNEFPINDKRTKEIATKYNLETTFIKNKLLWFDSVKQYIKTSHTLFQTENELLNLEKKFKKTLSYFLIKCPEIKETPSSIKKRIGLVEQEENRDDDDDEKEKTIKIKIKTDEDEDENGDKLSYQSIPIDKKEKTIKIKIKTDEDESPIIKNETIEIDIENEMEGENIENEMEGENIENEMEGENIENEMEGENIEK